MAAPAATTVVDVDQKVVHRGGHHVGVELQHHGALGGDERNLRLRHRERGGKQHIATGVFDSDGHRAGLGDLAVQDGNVCGAVFGVERGVCAGGAGAGGHVMAQVFAYHLDGCSLAVFVGLGFDLGDGGAGATAATTGTQ